METPMRVLSRHCFGALIAFVVGASATPVYAVTVVPDYMIIANASADQGHAFNMQNSEIGAIGPNFQPSRSVSPPAGTLQLPDGNPLLPTQLELDQLGFSGQISVPIIGSITLDGDVAITSDDGTLFTSSNSDVHIANFGPDSPGAQGIDCAGIGHFGVSSLRSRMPPP